MFDGASTEPVHFLLGGITVGCAAVEMDPARFTLPGAGRLEEQPNTRLSRFDDDKTVPGVADRAAEQPRPELRESRRIDRIDRDAVHAEHWHGREVTAARRHCLNFGLSFGARTDDRTHAVGAASDRYPDTMGLVLLECDTYAT